MTDYRKLVIEMVKRRHLLWDPSDDNYYNQDLKASAWNDIDSKIQLFPGCKKTAKEAWSQLMRGFCNVLKKKEKRKRGAQEKKWKFEADLQFLLPVKQKRLNAEKAVTTAKRLKPNPSDVLDSIDQINFELDDSSDAVSLDLDLGLNTSEEPKLKEEAEHDNANEGEKETTNEETQETKEELGKTHGNFEETNYEESQQHMETASTTCEDIKFPPIRRPRRTASPPAPRDNFLIELIRERDRESPRFSFLKSLAPMVEALTDDQFMDFQLNILNDLKNKKAERLESSYD